jgi:hypothetical protein
MLVEGSWAKMSRMREDNVKLHTSDGPFQVQRTICQQYTLDRTKDAGFHSLSGLLDVNMKQNKIK